MDFVNLTYVGPAAAIPLIGIDIWEHVSSLLDGYAMSNIEYAPF